MSDHLDSGREIELAAALAEYGTDAFEGQLLYELEMKESQLPTEAFCEQGGWPEKPSFKLNQIEAENEEIRVTVAVEFMEVVPSSCHDRPQRYPAFGELEILIDRKTGESVVRPVHD